MPADASVVAPHAWDRWRLFVWLLMCWVAPSLCCAPGLVLGKALFWHDVSITLLPIRRWAVECLHAGILPLWCHLAGGGSATFAESQAGVFYVPNLLSYLLEVPSHLDYVLQVWLHLGLAATLVFLWLRARGLSSLSCFLGGQVYGLSGFLVCHVMHLHMVQVAAWLPALLWLAEALAQRHADWTRAALAALLIGSLGVAGHLQSFLISLLATGLWFLLHLRRGAMAVPVARAATALALGLALTCAQLIPTALHTRASGARATSSLPFMTRYSLDARGLLFLLHPEILGTYREGNYFGGVHHYEVCGWVSGAALLLAVVGLARREDQLKSLAISSAVLVAVGLFLGLAVYNPLYRLLVHVPGINMFRAAGRYVLLVDLGLALLAAVGLEAVLQAQARRLLFSLGAMAVLTWLALPVAVRVGRPAVERILLREASHRARGDQDVARIKASAKVAFLEARLSPSDPYVLLWILTGASLALAGAGLRPLLSAGLLTACAMTHLLLFAYAYNPWAPREQLLQPPQTARLVANDPSLGRVFTDPSVAAYGRGPGWGYPWRRNGRLDWYLRAREALRPDSGIFFDVPHVATVFPLSPRRLWALTEDALPTALTGRRDAVARPLEVLKSLGATWIITSPQHFTKMPGTRPVLRIQDPDMVLAWMPLDRLWALAWVPLRVFPADGPNEAFRVMASPEWRGNSLVVERPPTPALAATGVVERMWYQAGHFRADMNLRNPGWVALAVPWNPGWQAFLDGHEATLYRGNLVMSALQAPAGHHTVELRYTAPGLGLGIAISLSALAVCFVLLIAGAGDVGGSKPL